MNRSDVIDLLVVDDDDEYRSTVVRRFARRGFQVQEAGDGNSALAQTQRREFDVVILDMGMPGMTGIEVLEKLKTLQPECEVVMLTGQGTIETAVQAMKLGASDFLQKPFPLAELETLVEKATRRHRLAKENVQLKELLRRQQIQREIVGQSPSMQELFHLISRAAPTDKAILIQGESGTGKELVARALHRQSQRAEMPLVIINCAALSETLLESELFGHEKGAFTGAVSAKPGLFEMADQGTLFIDEIGEMPGSLQAKLLRVLEDGSMRRVGSVQERRVDVRILAATNRDLAVEVADGRFREDLFYRINVMSLVVPPLRERGADIRLLVDHLIGEGWQIESEALAVIERYPWPGNVRQLINALERAKIMSEDRWVRRAGLPREVTHFEPANNHRAIDPVDATLDGVERAHVLEVFQREGGNKARTARALGVNRRSLYRLLEKYNIPSEGA